MAAGRDGCGLLGAVEDAPDGPALAPSSKRPETPLFFLAKFDVPARRQARAAELGYCTLAVFEIMADDRTPEDLCSWPIL